MREDKHDTHFPSSFLSHLTLRCLPTRLNRRQGSHAKSRGFFNNPFEWHSSPYHNQPPHHSEPVHQVRQLVQRFYLDDYASGSLCRERYGVLHKPTGVDAEPCSCEVGSLSETTHSKSPGTPVTRRTQCNWITWCSRNAGGRGRVHSSLGSYISS